MIKIDTKPGNRVVFLTVGMVALAGLVVGAASYVQARRVAASYEGAMERELEQKGLAYGQTTQSLLNLIASTSPETFQSLLERASGDPADLFTTFAAAENGEFQNTPLGYEVWTESPSAPGGYAVLLRRYLAGVETEEADPTIPALVTRTAATGQPVAVSSAWHQDLHYSVLIRVGEQPIIVAVALDASQEYGFIHLQRARALRNAIFFSLASVAFVSIVGIGASYLVSRTLTNRKFAEEALRDSELRYRTLAELSPVGIFRLDDRGRSIYSNERSQEILGRPPEAGRGEGWAEGLHPEDRERVLAEWTEAMGRGALFRSECRFVRLDGTDIWVLGQIAPERNTHGEVIGHVGTVTDITEQKRLEETLREEARHDRLTGALNHGSVIEEVRRLTVSADHGRFAVAMIDVDGMKAINDTYGHPVGDQALQALARALHRPGAIVGRYGGDEFIVVLPGAGHDEALRYHRDVRSRLSQTNLIDPDTNARVSISATFGFAMYPEEAESIVDLIKLADGAMYAERRQRPLLPETRTRRSATDDRAARMVGEIVPLLTSTGTVQTKLRAVAHRLLVGLGYDAVTVVLFSPQRGGPALSATVARVDREMVRMWDEDQARQGDASIFRALLEDVQKPFIISDLERDERLAAPQRELLVQAGLRSGLVVPMVWQGRTLGALAVASRQTAAYSPQDAQLLNMICGQVTAIVRMHSLLEELQDVSAQVTKAQEETVLLLAAAAEAHDGTTGLHLQHMRVLTEALARELGHPPDEATNIGLAAILHDIGKLFVPETILTSAGPLDEHGWELMKRHTALGQQFLAGHAGFELAATIARHHHERWDGNGYPDGLAGDAIPEAAAIVTVADAFDAMTSDRPYRRPISVNSATLEITTCSGTQFSPHVVEALRRLQERGELAAGEAARQAA